MSQVLAFSNHDEPVLEAKGELHLDWLCQQIIANRFLPVPPEEAVFVGDGDYRAIGAEFLGHAVQG